jgi:toxin ParE1/3/4
MVGYKLSALADEDFESLYVYGVLAFGLGQADVYVAGMQARFELLANQPRLYPAIDHVRLGYRLSVYGSHAIYYQIVDDGVLIVRILNGQDVSHALAEGCEDV